jgi:hypothetical protein
MKLLYQAARFVCFDNEPAAGAAGAGAGAAGAGTGDPPPAASKTYTQAEFDSHMGAMRRKHEAREQQLTKAQRDLAGQLEAQKNQKGLSEEERTTLQARIDELEGQFLTAQEKAERKATQEREASQVQVQQLTTERDSFRTIYQREVVSNQITRAGSNNNAHDVDQISAIVGPMISFKDVVDEDGKPTGQQAPVVKFPDIDKDKKPIVMEYTIDEAVKRMTELDKFANLFVDTKRSGVGGHRNTGVVAGKLDLPKLARENPAEFRRLRKEKPDLFYKSGGAR